MDDCYEFFGRGWTYTARGYVKMALPVALAALFFLLTGWALLSGSFSQGTLILAALTAFFGFMVWVRYHWSAKELFATGRARSEARIVAGQDGIKVCMFDSNYLGELRAALQSGSLPNEDLFDRNGEVEIIWIPWNLLMSAAVEKNLLISTLVIDMAILREESSDVRIAGGMRLKIYDHELSQSPARIADQLNQWKSNSELRRSLPPIIGSPIDVEVTVLPKS